MCYIWRHVGLFSVSFQIPQQRLFATFFQKMENKQGLQVQDLNISI